MAAAEAAATDTGADDDGPELEEGEMSPTGDGGELGDGEAPADASTSLTAQVAQHEMIRCCVTRERVHNTGFTVYQRSRYDLENRRSRRGTEIAHLQLAAKQRRYFSAIGVSHADAWAAIRDRNFSYVYDALRRGFPVNQRDKTSGRTMLHEAAAVGDAEICELLLDWPGCSKQARCLVGRDSAIHFAATGGNWRIIDMLCRYGADARELDKYRLTPMHMATTTAAVQHLMRFGADERDRDRFGRTPGMCADERGDAAVASLMAELVLMRLKQAQQKEQNKTVTAKKATVAREQRLAEAAVRDEIRAKKQRLRALKDDYAAWRLPDGSGKSRPKPSAAKSAADDASHKALLAKYDARARKAGRDATLRLFGSG